MVCVIHNILQDLHQNQFSILFKSSINSNFTINFPIINQTRFKAFIEFVHILGNTLNNAPGHIVHNMAPVIVAGYL